MGFLKKVDKGVFYPSAIVCLIFVIWTVSMPKAAGKVFDAVLGFFNGNFGWSYLITVTIFVVICFILAFSKYGEIKLGKDDDEPEYSTRSWFAMLFSAAMGIGLVFWSVAEPMTHFMTPPIGEGGTTESAELALRYTFFHWGLHPWSVYALTGMALAYFGFRKGLPAKMSSTFEPIIGKENLEGPVAKLIDIISVFATVFGVATSLGLGAMQINGGLSFLYGLTNSTSVTMVIIAVVTVLFTISAVTGIQRGIRILSNINMSIVTILLLYLVVAGPTVYLLNTITTTIGDYLQNIVWMSFYTDMHGAYADNTGYDWVGGWTIFYWAWWISWGPFVGGFIARISKGRTVREFVIGVLLAPTLLSFIWLGIFGGAALHIDLFGAGGIGEAVSKEMTSALFVTLDSFPMGSLFAFLATILIATFFITSADSATFVLGMFTSGGELEPDRYLKVFWGIIEGATAAVLLLAGGLNALQTASIASAFPFMIVVVFMLYAMFKSFKGDLAEKAAGKSVKVPVSDKKAPSA